MRARRSSTQILLKLMALLVPLTLAACQSESTPGDPDGSGQADAGADAGADVDVDAGVDAHVDAGVAPDGTGPLDGADAGGGDEQEIPDFEVDDPTAQVRLEPVEETPDRVIFDLVLHNLGRVHSVAARIHADPSELSFEQAENAAGLPPPAVVQAEPFDTGVLWLGGALTGLRDVSTAQPVLVARLTYLKVGTGPTRVEILLHNRGIMDATGTWHAASWSGAHRGDRGKTRTPPGGFSPRIAALPTLLEPAAVDRPDAWMDALPPAPRGGYELDVEQISVAVGLDPADLQLSVDATYTLAVTSGSMDQLTFALFDHFGPIDPQVEVDLVPVEPSVEPLPDTSYLTIAFPLPRIVNQGERIDVRLRFTGEPDCEVMVDPLPVRACQVAPDGVAFHFGTFLPVALGGPAPPRVDLFDGNLTVTMPAAYLVGATGALTETTQNPDGTRSHVFQSRNVRSQLFGASTNFTEALASLDGIPIRVLGYDPSEVAAAADQIEEILRSHGARLGDYAYEGLHVTELPMSEVGVGNAAGIFVTRTALGDGIGHVAHLAHELGHQWIAGMLPMDTSTSFFLQEGLTELTAYQYLSEWSLGLYGTDRSVSRREQNNLRVTFGVAPSDDIPMASPLDAFGNAFYPLCYLKSQGAIRTLMSIIGDEVHGDAMRSLVADNLFSRALNAERYQQAMEDASGLDLQRFFDEWVYGTGYPRYRITYQATPLTGGRYQIDLELHTDDDFHLPITLALYDALGEQDAREIVQTSPGTTTVSYQLPFCPEAYALDPEVSVIHLSRTDPSGDVYRDGDVDGIDLAYTSLFFGGEVFGNVYHPFVDFDLDGQVDQADLDVLQASFGSAGSCKGQ